MLAVESGLPVAAEALDEFRVFSLLLPVEILQLTADFNHARKAGAVFGAELRLFLLQIAAAGVNLLEERGGKVGVLSLQARICGDHHLRVALRGGAILGFAEDAVGGGGNKLAAELVDFHQSRGVLGFAGLAVGLHLGRAHDAVLRFEIGKALLITIDADLQICKLGVQPARCLRRGLNLRFGLLLLKARMSALTTAADNAASWVRKRISIRSVWGMVSRAGAMRNDREARPPRRERDCRD